MFTASARPLKVTSICSKSRISTPPIWGNDTWRVFYFVDTIRPNSRNHLLIIQKPHSVFQLRILLALETALCSFHQSARYTATIIHSLWNECWMIVLMQLLFQHYRSRHSFFQRIFCFNIVIISIPVWRMYLRKWCWKWQLLDRSSTFHAKVCSDTALSMQSITILLFDLSIARFLKAWIICSFMSLLTPSSENARGTSFSFRYHK